MERIVLSIYLGILSVFDYKERRVPVIWLMLGILAAMLMVLGDCLKNPQSWQWLVMAAMLGTLPGIFMLLVGYFSRKVGCGDGLVLIGVGIVTGYRECFSYVCFSLLLMSICCVGLLLMKKGNRNTQIPYLPFLTVVYLVGMFV